MESEQIQAETGLLEAYLDSRRAKTTAEGYAYALSNIFFEDEERGKTTAKKKRERLSKAVDDFVFLARTQPKTVEQQIIKWIIKWRDSGKFKGGSIRLRVSILKSLLDFHDAASLINWKKLAKIIPTARKVTVKRPYKIEEIRKLLSALDMRGRFAVLFYVSSGARAKAISDPRPLRVGDVERIKVNEDIEIGHIRIYRDTPEEYDAFLTPEALKAMDEYLSWRRRFNEEITQESPLFRAEIDTKEALKDPRIVPSMVRAAGDNAIKMQIYWALVSVFPGKRDFKQLHGFRSFFKSQLENAGMKSLYVETLLGHVTKASDPDGYFKPTVENLAKEYAKYMDVLTIDESLHLAREVQKKEEEKREIEDKYFIRCKQLEEKIQELNYQRSVDQNALSALLSGLEELKKEITKLKEGNDK
jgi:site-specific recombinase XerD